MYFTSYLVEGTRSPLLTQCLYEALRVVKHNASDKSPFNCTMALNKTLNQSKNLSREPTNIEPLASLKSPRNINLFSNHSLSSLFALSSAWSSSLCSRILFNTSSLASCNLKRKKNGRLDDKTKSIKHNAYK